MNQIKELKSKLNKHPGDLSSLDKSEILSDTAVNNYSVVVSQEIPPVEKADALALTCNSSQVNLQGSLESAEADISKS